MSNGVNCEQSVISEGLELSHRGTHTSNTSSKLVCRSIYLSRYHTSYHTTETLRIVLIERATNMQATRYTNTVEMVIAGV